MTKMSTWAAYLITMVAKNAVGCLRAHNGAQGSHILAAANRSSVLVPWPGLRHSSELAQTGTPRNRF